MPTDLWRQQLQRLARLGAARRLQELQDEEAAIRAAFPDLPKGTGAARGRGGSRRGRKGAARQSATAAKKRRRSNMSAAQRRAASERMKKYWAARRKVKE